MIKGGCRYWRGIGEWLRSGFNVELKPGTDEMSGIVLKEDRTYLLIEACAMGCDMRTYGIGVRSGWMGTTPCTPSIMPGKEKQLCHFFETWTSEEIEEDDQKWKIAFEKMMAERAEQERNRPPPEPLPEDGICPDHPDVEPHMGFGLMGGGYGPYTLCNECGRLLSKTNLPEDME